MIENSIKKHPLLVRALRGEKTERTPVWFMRQAGRYLPEYNEIRRGLTFIELTQNPELASEVTIQPYRRFQVDGLIMFADILTPLHGAGVPLHFEEKKGPILEQTISSRADLSMLDSFDPDKDTSYVRELIGRLRAFADGVSGDIPAVLGFAGAPFTMASYLIEGGTTKKFEKIKAMMFSDPELFHSICSRVADMTIDYLKMQIHAGVDAVQIFDSWGGILSLDHYREFSAPYTNRIIQALQKEFGREKPVILFVGNAAHLLGPMVEAFPSAISLDWRVTPESALTSIPESIAIQGNMDPLVLYGSPDRVRSEAKRILQSFRGRPGYVFNLGHGIHPGSPMECVKAMIETVRSNG